MRLSARTVAASCAAAVVAVAVGGGVLGYGTSTSGADPMPSPKPCGPFSGVGPVPGCTYTQTGPIVQIVVHNTASRPVQCSLAWPGTYGTSASTTIAPGADGTLNSSIAARLRFTATVDCVSTGGGEMSRHATIRFASYLETPSSTVIPPRTLTPSGTVRPTSPSAVVPPSVG